MPSGSRPCCAATVLVWQRRELPARRFCHDRRGVRLVVFRRSAGVCSLLCAAACHAARSREPVPLRPGNSSTRIVFCGQEAMRLACPPLTAMWSVFSPSPGSLIPTFDAAVCGLSADGPLHTRADRPATRLRLRPTRKCVDMTVGRRAKIHSRHHSLLRGNAVEATIASLCLGPA